MPVVHFFLFLLLLPALTIPVPAAAHDLPNGATVRFQSDEFGPGWHVGTVQITTEGCAMVWKPAPEVSGGRRGLGLMFIQNWNARMGQSGSTCWWP
ncbi:MAG: hypothetical protein HY348_01695 [Nitrospira defluvii]|nr:hypothetical protein [Nitrospira defluvii]